MRCYTTLECVSCENTIYRLIFLLGEHRGLPVVPADVGELDRFECDACGTINLTGELPVHTEDNLDDLDEDDDE